MSNKAEPTDTLSDVIDKYRKHVKHFTDLRRTTINNYISTIRLFLIYCHGVSHDDFEGNDKKYQQTRDEILSGKTYESIANMSLNETEEKIESFVFTKKKSTIGTHLSALKDFFARVDRDKLTALQSVKSKVKFRNTKRDLRKRLSEILLTKDQVYEVINNAPNLKIKAALQLGYDCAMRTNELLSRNVEDIDLSKRSVEFIPEKKAGGRELAVPFWEDRTDDILSEYMQEYDLMYEGEIRKGEYLFPSSRWNTRLSGQHLIKKMRVSMFKAGIEREQAERTRYHDFARHFRCTHLLKNIDLRLFDVQKRLRHEDPKTTVWYEHLLPTDIRQKRSEKEGIKV